MLIKDIYAREILDSRGNPTIEVEMKTDNDIICIASVPSGASTGSREALELRDGDKSRYDGKGVLNAVLNVNKIIRPALLGQKLDQVTIDKKLLELDGTDNKSKLGANAILAVSLACLKCLAKFENKELYEYVSSKNVSLPIPMINIINGGKHAVNNIDIQEFMIIPVVKGISERIRAGAEIFHSLKQILVANNFNVGVGDEGGFAPNLQNNAIALELIVQAIKKAGYKPGEEVFIGLDVAASEIYDKGITLVAASSIEKDFEGSGGNIAGAKKVGAAIAKKALEKGINEVVFDRGGYIYHGRVAALAEAAREAGLKF
mgnify:CR=1 FL=1